MLFAAMLAGCEPASPPPAAVVETPSIAADVDIEGVASYIDALPRWEEVSSTEFAKKRDLMCAAYRKAAVVLCDYTVDELSVILENLSRRAGASRSTTFLLTRFIFEFPEKPLAKVDDRAGFFVDPKGGPTSESWPIGRDAHKRLVITDPFRGTTGRFSVVKDYLDAAGKYKRRAASDFQ